MRSCCLVPCRFLLGLAHVISPKSQFSQTVSYNARHCMHWGTITPRYRLLYLPNRNVALRLDGSEESSSLRRALHRSDSQNPWYQCGSRGLQLLLCTTGRLERHGRLQFSVAPPRDEGLVRYAIQNGPSIYQHVGF